MPNYVRWREDGATYFFTVVTFHRRPLFNNSNARRLLRHAIVDTRRRWPFDHYACVLLPDHLHCIWTLPDGDDNFPLRWSFLKRRFAQEFIADGGKPLPVTHRMHKKRELGVWQPRYWEHRVRDEAELFAYRDYIHFNPVKHGYVNDPYEWPYSSVHRHQRLGWLTDDWTSRTALNIEATGE